MKRIIAFWMTLVLICMCGISASAVAATEEAEALNTLGLLKGTENGYELEKSLTRAEAITLLVRVLGKAEEAETCEKTHPFTDVAPWADGYVSYAYENGLTNGISDTEFGADDTVESNMFLTFLLRALGYEDGENADFIWQMPYALAAECEMLPQGTELKNFTRNEAVILMAAALFAKEKGKETTLSESLIDVGAFSAKEFKTAFPEDPFSDYKEINRAVCEAVPFHEAEYKRQNVHTFNNVMLLQTEEKEGEIHAYVLSSHADYTVGEGNNILVRGSGAGAKTIVLDKNTLEILSVSWDSVRKELLPESAIGTEVNNLIWKGMNIVLGKKVDKAIAEGTLAWRQPTYAETMEELANDKMNVIEKTIEAEECTIVIGYLGGVMHGPHGWVRVIYKEGSEMGEGKVINLPLPQVNGWGGTEAPESLTVSDDGKKAAYSFFFESDMILDPGLPSERVIHEAGTYQYTVDLVSGETELAIIK